MLYNEKNYTIPVNYIFNHYIREYDISKANINILFAKGIINKSLYDELYSSDRMIRQVYIGKLLRDNDGVSEVLSSGILEYKKKFFESNNISDSDIVSIKNDAVFVLNKIPTICNFDNITFALKNTYTSFMKLPHLEIYYSNTFDGEYIDIKGIKDTDLELYHMNFLSIIIDYLRSIQKEGLEYAYKYISDILNMYVKLELPIGCYRRFSSSNDFTFKTLTDSYSIRAISDTRENKKSLDISYNFELLKIMHVYASQILYEEKIRG